MNGLKVRDSKIEGKGLFADKEFNEGDIIGIAHINDVATSMIGRFHNHSDNPNAHSISIGNKRYLAALRPLMKGEEITVDYRRQPELEQPEEFRKGGLVKMPKPSKKGLASKKYTKSLLGTNRLFTKNPLYEKPKFKKNRVYDPNAKYYQTGGSSGKPDSKTSFYSVEGSDGVYRKVGNTWEVDWNRSGNFQPLSKGDVAKRTAVLNSQAKPLYDPTYDDTYTTRQSAYTAKPKAAPVKNVTPQDRAAQQAFNKDFKVTDKSNFEVVQDKINQDKQNYIEHAKERGYEATQDELDQLEERGWVQYGNVGASSNPYSMKQAGPAEKPQEFWDKAGDIISNPMTSAGFLIRGQAIPDYMQRNMDRGTFGYYANGQFHTERNPLDLAVADATGLSLVNDARNVYKGIENRDVAQAGLGALGFIPGVTELKNAGKALKFAGPMKHAHQDVPEVLNALRQRGQYWDNTGAVGKDLLHPDMINYHGTYSGRPIVEVRMPDGSSEMFYKSSGWAGKKGSGVNNTTEGMWQVYGGHAYNPLNQADNWFVKDYGFEDYYGSNTFGNMAENMDNALMQKLNFKSVDELDNAFNFQNRFGDVDSYTPKQTGGESGDRFKKRLMKRYPGMQGVYGPEGENLNIVKDRNYDARSVGYGDIEFMAPGLEQVNYKNRIDKTLPGYTYVNPSPDKYTSVYNPRGANRADIFLDMMHGMRDDQNYEPLLQNFDKAVRDARGGDMQYYYEKDVAKGYTDSQEQWNENYVDGQLRAQLAPGTLGMFSHGRRDYRKERRHDSPEMRTAAKDIRSYIKGEYQDGGEPKRYKTRFDKEYAEQFPKEDWAQYVQEEPGVVVRPLTSEQQQARNMDFFRMEMARRNPHLYLPDGTLRPQAAQAADWFWQLGMTGPAALKAAGSVLAKQIPKTGITYGTALNTAAGIHGATQVPQRIQDWQDVAAGEKDWREATAESLMTALELYGGLSELKGFKGVPKELPGSPNNTVNIQKAGMLNPFAIADAIVPRLPHPVRIPLMGAAPEGLGPFTGSPLNFIPGYGKTLGKQGNAFRKFGNTMEYVQDSKTLSPKGGSPLRIGRDQIVSEGNWAALDQPWENYPGTFAAEFDFAAPGSNLGYVNPSSRNGVLITDRAKNTLVEIPVSDPGLSFHRRLPFSNRYVPINKEKLLNNQFQLATQGGHFQSLVEKYGYGLAYAAMLGAMGNDEAVKTYNKYTIDPIIKEAKQLLNYNNK